VTELILASTSPARKKLLTEAGIRFTDRSPGVDEDLEVELHKPETAEQLTELLARKKAEAVAATAANAIVLGCDSALLLDGEILGKPLTAEVAIARWGKLRGNSGTLYSGHHLIDTESKQVTSLVTKTEVNFSDLSDDQIARYVATGEPLQVAGAFTIDGLGGAFIESISGDYHTVVGLSLVGLRKMITELGHDYQDFWR